MPVETLPTIERRQELFGTFNPNFRISDPLMLDSTGEVSRAISEIVSPEYDGISVWDSQSAIDLLIHYQAGLAMRERGGRVPFINEFLVAHYLTSNFPSIVLLDVGSEQLPPVHGLDGVIRRFDADTHVFPSDPKLTRFQTAKPFRGLYSDPYSEVQTELVPDANRFRLQIISDLIHTVEKRDPIQMQELRRLRYSLQHGFNFDGLSVEYGNPRNNIADAIPSCVNGLVGSVREAAIAYEADPSIEIIGLYPYVKSPFKYFVATECLGLQEGKDFTFDLDSSTGNHLFRLQAHHMRGRIDDFPYTHHLEKKPMPEEIVKVLAAST